MNIPPIDEILIVDDDAPGGVRRLTPADVEAQLRAVLGQRLPGGCDDCNAEHEYTNEVDGIFDLWIHHSESCPTLRDTSE